MLAVFSWPSIENTWWT